MLKLLSWWDIKIRSVKFEEATTITKRRNTQYADKAEKCLSVFNNILMPTLPYVLIGHTWLVYHTLMKMRLIMLESDDIIFINNFIYQVKLQHELCFERIIIRRKNIVFIWTVYYSFKMFVLQIYVGSCMSYERAEGVFNNILFTHK